MTQRTLGFGAAFLALVAGLMSAPQVLAASASPAAVTVDCGIDNGVTSTTITGQPGDTMTITNTSGSNACTFAAMTGVVTVGGLNGSNELTSGAQADVTIVAAGTFTVTPSSASPVTGTMTVAIGTPVLQQEYNVTFDANGGTCNLTSQTIAVAAGDWYALPTEGTDSFQCYRDGYSLAGWMRNDTLLFGGGPQQAPDIPVGNQASAADHVMLFAVWIPLGLELTLDANVGISDQCLSAAGANLPVAERSVTTLIPFGSVVGYELPASPPCVPPNYEFLGWGLTGNASGRNLTALPSEDLGVQFLTLYAMWRSPSCWSLGPGADLRGCNYGNTAMQGLDLRGADLRNANLFAADFANSDLSGALLGGATMDEITLQGANLSDAQMAGVSLNTANMQGANLTGANLQGANLSLSCLLGATLNQTNLDGANVGGATTSFGSPPPFVGVPDGRPLNTPGLDVLIGEGSMSCTPPWWTPPGPF